MSGMLSSRETMASGVPGVSSDPSNKPGTVSASVRRRSQFDMRVRVPSVALAAAQPGPGPGF
eukprot:11124798-Alexandrium_andersonii.AAC.1